MNRQWFDPKTQCFDPMYDELSEMVYRLQKRIHKLKPADEQEQDWLDRCDTTLDLAEGMLQEITTMKEENSKYIHDINKDMDLYERELDYLMETQ